MTATLLRDLQIETVVTEDEYGDDMYVTYFDQSGNKAEFGIYFSSTDSFCAGWELLQQGGNFELYKGYVIHSYDDDYTHPNSWRPWKRSDVYLKGNLVESYIARRGHRNSSINQARDFCQNNPLD